MSKILPYYIGRQGISHFILASFQAICKTSTTNVCTSIVGESRLSDYTINGTRQNGYRIVDKTFALKSLMANCLDFEEEETLLQSMGREMGVLVDRTPKCHCEMAGEGIEYSWGCAKNSFRRVPLKQRRGKDNFRNVVRMCLSREKV
jgi:hypothetical protein